MIDQDYATFKEFNSFPNTQSVISTVVRIIQVMQTAWKQAAKWPKCTRCQEMPLALSQQYLILIAQIPIFNLNNKATQGHDTSAERKSKNWRLTWSIRGVRVIIKWKHWLLTAQRQVGNCWRPASILLDLFQTGIIHQRAKDVIKKSIKLK